MQCARVKNMCILEWFLNFFERCPNVSAVWRAGEDESTWGDAWQYRAVCAHKSNVMMLVWSHCNPRFSCV